MSNVEPIRKEPQTPAAEETQPGIDLGYAYAIDEKRSLSVRTIFAQGTSPKLQEKIIGQLFSVTAVAGLKEKLIEHKRERANAERRLTEISVDPERRTALLAEIESLKAESLAHAETEEQKFRASGRHGTFKMVGAANTKAQGYVADITRRDKELETLDLDMKRQRDELQKAIDNYGVAIANVESEIALRREAYGE